MSLNVPCVLTKAMGFLVWLLPCDHQAELVASLSYTVKTCLLICMQAFLCTPMCFGARGGQRRVLGPQDWS